jgi:hypothetical protein
MSPSWPELLKLLSDTGEHDAIDDAAKTPTPEKLIELAKQPASMLWTARMIQQESSSCWVKRLARRFILVAAFTIGVLATVQVGGAWWIKSTLEARDTVLRQHIQTTIERALLKQRAELGLATHDGQALAEVRP